MKKWVFRLLLFFVWSVDVRVHAAERYEFYNGIRQMSMGGAAIAVVNDETSLLVNPAGLGKLRDFIVTVFDPELDIGAETQTIIGTDVNAITNPQKLLDKLNQNKGKHMHARAQVFPSLVVPNFGFGIFGKYSVDGSVDDTGTNFSLDYTNDYALVLGFNLRIWDGIIKIGANARVINRVQVSETTIPAASTGLSISSMASEGVGVASDVGMIITVPVVWLPTISGVIRDTGDTRYTLRKGMFTNSATRPAPTSQTIDAAFALFPIHGKSTRSSFTAEYKDVMNVAEEKDAMRRVHVGYELNIGDAFFIRGGMNQRYWTAGLELAVGNYQLQLGSYGEDIGVDKTPVEDRRYIGKFSFRF